MWNYTLASSASVIFYHCTPFVPVCFGLDSLSRRTQGVEARKKTGVVDGKAHGFTFSDSFFPRKFAIHFDGNPSTVSQLHFIVHLSAAFTVFTLFHANTLNLDVLSEPNLCLPLCQKNALVFRAIAAAAATMLNTTTATEGGRGDVSVAQNTQQSL